MVESVLKMQPLNKFNIAFVLLATICCVKVSVAQEPASATLTTLYTFQGGTDGYFPEGTLLSDSSGALYGITTGGGSADAGIVYQLTPPAGAGGVWTETVLHNFTRLPNGLADSGGGGPIGGLVFDAYGNLYGTTYFGGTINAACPGGCGVVFQLSPPAAPGAPWTETVLYSFAGNADAGSNGPLVLDNRGVLYGTGGGGTLNAGRVYMLSPAAPGQAWTETVLYNFTGGTDGSGPAAGVVFDDDGALYGTTAYGGSSVGNGVVFRLAPPTVAGGAWTETVLHTFMGQPDGEQPVASLTLDPQGRLYGSTEFGGDTRDACGTVFQLTPSPGAENGWTFASIRSFESQRTGCSPFGSLALDKTGGVYGTAAGGGANQAGTIFGLQPPSVKGGAWKATVLHSFTLGVDGYSPESGLLRRGRASYGTTRTTVFQLTR